LAKRTEELRWLLLIHQIPLQPPYFRVKIWRRLQALGAVAIRKSVYALPAGGEAREDLEWVVREIIGGGGEASLVEGRLVEGLSDEQAKELFRAARDADYSAIADEARALAARLPKRGRPAADLQHELAQALAKLKKRLAEVAAVDFFDARGRPPAEGLVSELEERLREPEPEPAESAKPPVYRKRTWVTRAGIHVDRMASAWLIRRFIDPEARFKFVAAKEHQHKAGELRFDMFEGEFTHEGELSSFEVLLQRFELTDAALRAIGELVHDIDLKDDKYARPEKAGIEAVVNAIAMSHRDDGARLERATALFDDLHQMFQKRRPA
jgi:hypothetical protein